MDREIELSRNQVRALSALLTNKTIKEAAEDANLSPSTIYGYLNDKGFQEELRYYQHARLQYAANKMTSLLEESADVLQELLQSHSATDATRARIALSTWDIVRRNFENEELRRRMEKIEKLLEGRNENTT
jgi:AraC-like DNA-binding protein